MTTPKLLVLWFLIATVTLVAGWFLLLHGGVYSESAARSGEPSFFYQLEAIVGQILMWPVFGIVWLWELLFPSNRGRNVSEYLVLALHYTGYGLAFIIFRYYAGKKDKLKGIGSD